MALGRPHHEVRAFLAVPRKLDYALGAGRGHRLYSNWHATELLDERSWRGTIGGGAVILKLKNRQQAVLDASAAA